MRRYLSRLGTKFQEGIIFAGDLSDQVAFFMRMKNILYCLALGTVMLVGGCTESKDLSSMPAYDGPQIVARNIEMFMSDSAVIRIKLTAPLQHQFESGDQEFPDGLHMDFLEPDGHTSSTVDSNVGYYYQETKLWKVVGNVVLQGLDRGERLTTEELWWDPSKKEVFTEDETKVTIREGNEILQGKGLWATQDFSDFTLKEVTGEFTVEDDEEVEE